MKKVVLSWMMLLLGCLASAQVSDPFYQSVVNMVSYDTVLSHLQHLESLGVKQPGTAALQNTKNWLVSKYQSYGYTDIVLDDFTYSGNTLTNVVITKTGSLHPNTYLIVSGHYDTKTGTGTNDNGSGVSIILEVARLLAAVNTKYSVRFINFSGEESGLKGSKHYADDIAEAQGMDILLVFNIDEVGGIAGMINNTIRCESDQSSYYPSVSSNNAASAAYTDTLVTLTHLYSTLSTAITNAYGSDYMPFEYNGEIITGYYEDNESSVVNTANDNLDHLDTSYVYQIARAATGATLYFAGTYDDITSVSQCSTIDDLVIYPNPFSDRIVISCNSEKIEIIKIFNLQGTLVADIQADGAAEQTVDLSHLNSGLYILEVFGDSGNVFGRKIISKM